MVGPDPCGSVAYLNERAEIFDVPAFCDLFGGSFLSDRMIGGPCRYYPVFFLSTFLQNLFGDRFTCHFEGNRLIYYS